VSSSFFTDRNNFVFSFFCVRRLNKNSKTNRLSSLLFFCLESHRGPSINRKQNKLQNQLTTNNTVIHLFHIRFEMKSKRWVGLARLTAETAGSGPLADFVEGLGPGQLVGRQVLAAPALGDVQLALCDRKGRLEVEVIRARGLQARTGSKLLPGKTIEQTHNNKNTNVYPLTTTTTKSIAPYVKVYLVSGKRCLAKAKTATARRTLDPLYQQQLSFSVLYQGCVLQVSNLDGCA